MMPSALGFGATPGQILNRLMDPCPDKAGQDNVALYKPSETDSHSVCLEALSVDPEILNVLSPARWKFSGAEVLTPAKGPFTPKLGGALAAVPHFSGHQRLVRSSSAVHQGHAYPSA